MYFSSVILKVVLTSIGCTEGSRPISEVKTGDSLGKGNQIGLHLRWRIHKCSVTDSF